MSAGSDDTIKIAFNHARKTNPGSTGTHQVVFAGGAVVTIPKTELRIDKGVPTLVAYTLTNMANAEPISFMLNTSAIVGIFRLSEDTDLS